jgi:CRP-like cAMP-binding protein
VFEEGDQGAVLYVIQSGMVELVRCGPEGPRLVARLAPGEFFGELDVLLGRPRSVRAVAASESRLIELDAATFEEMCVAQPEIAIRVIQRLAARVIELEQRLAALGLDDLLRPVVRVLLRRADREGKGAGWPPAFGDLPGRPGSRSSKPTAPSVSSWSGSWSGSSTTSL